MGEIRIVGLGKTRGCPYRVCKKTFSETKCYQSTTSNVFINVNIGEKNHSFNISLNFV